ncbi:MAG: DUF1972 domain-containing protein [Rhodothermales bacterium]
MSKLNIKIIGCVGLPPRYGGWETLANFLTLELSGDFSFEVFCSSWNYDRQLAEFNGARLRYLPLKANGVSSIFYDLISMLLVSRSNSIKLVLGVSGCIFLPILKTFSKGYYVVNIDGHEWRRAKWGWLTKEFLKLSEAVAVHFADVVVVDNPVLAQYISREYGINATTVAYGGDHCVPLPISGKIIQAYPWVKSKYGFMVCRIEPENNIEMVLDCFSRQNVHTMVIVGNWKDSLFGRAMKEKYAQFEMLQLIDAIYDQSVLDQIRSNAHFYVHGHSAGGTNPSLVEAMSLGLPVFAFRVDFNIATTFEEAFYFSTADELTESIKLLSDEDLDQCGRTMRQIALENYNWRCIASKYREIFRKVSQ